MDTVIIILSVLAAIILLGCIFMAAVVIYINRVYNDLENLRHLEDDDDEENKDVL